MQKKNTVAFSAILVVGLVFGFVLGSAMPGVSAQNTTVVDENLLTKLYDLAFHRPLDNEALGAHGGKALDTVLNDIIASEEHQAYDGVYTAVKAYEEARRAPDDVSSADENAYLDIIDSALSHVRTWADNLPEQALENRVIGPDAARTAIQNVYDNLLDDTAKASAETGLFQSLDSLGQPDSLPLPSDTPGQ